jgi:hypothetical protein
MKLAVRKSPDDAVHEVGGLDAATPFLSAMITFPVATSNAAKNVVVPCRV